MNNIEKLLTKRFFRIAIVATILCIDACILEKFNIRPAFCFVSISMVYVWILFFYGYCLNLEIENEKTKD